MAIRNINNEFIQFHVPNSETIIECQRIGIKDRSVGQYYIGNNIKAIEDFIRDFDILYFIDFASCYLSLRPFFHKIKNLGVDKLYKYQMSASFDALELIQETIIKDHTNSFFMIEKPKLGLTKKYLKIESKMSMFILFKQLILGDLVDLVLEKHYKIVRIHLIPNSLVQSFDTLIDFSHYFKKLDSNEEN
jgi:hypothetical protein